MSFSDNRAVVYARFSPRPNPKLSESLQVQINRCRSYCEHQGLVIVGTFEDPEVSARTIPLMERPAGSSMLDFVRQNNIKHIVSMRLDRLFRNSLDGMATVFQLNQDDVSVHFADQGGNSICTGTSIGQLIFSIMLAISEFEPRQTAERTSRSLNHKQAHGKRVSRHAPFGWYIDARDPKRLIKNPPEQLVIKRILAMHNLGYNNTQIRIALTNEGISFRGRGFESEQVKQIIYREKMRKEAGMSDQENEEVAPAGMVPSGVCPGDVVPGSDDFKAVPREEDQNDDPQDEDLYKNAGVHSDEVESDSDNSDSVDNAGSSDGTGAPDEPTEP